MKKSNHSGSLTKCKTMLFRCHAMYQTVYKYNVLNAANCWSSYENNETNMLSAVYISFPAAVIIALLISNFCEYKVLYIV